MEYGSWLQDRAADLVAAREMSDYSWNASDTDFVEWLNALEAVGVLRYKGQPMNTARYQEWAARSLSIRVRNFYDRSAIIRNRKKERAVFTKRALATLEVWMKTKDDRGRRIRR